jgi:hypothetical protein
MKVAERKRKGIKACCRGEARKEISDTNAGCLEGEGEIKACCRRRREKGSFRT